MTSSYVNGVTTTYAYRGDGLRRSKSTNGVTTNHVWDGDQIVQDLNGIDVSREYVRGLRLIDTYAVGDTARIAYIQNARGDVVGHVNTLTTAIDFVDYDAYGNFESSAPSDPLAYCGEYLDSETGFIYLRARYYDPNLGRFTTEDPARDGLNWYVYCNNNPVNFVDPSGLAEVALREYIESRGGIVTPVQHKFLFVSYGLSHIDVTLNGRTHTYTSDDYVIRDKTAYIDDSVLFNDFAVLTPSADLRNFIKNYEGYSSTVYDAVPGTGDWTIGWGHKTTKDAKSITKSQAEAFFEADMQKMITSTLVPFLRENNIILSQQQFDAMVSFTYNFGEYSWGKNGYQTMKNFLIAGDFSDAATRKAFSMYMGKRQLPGQIKRRIDEIEMFLSGDYRRTN